MYVLGSGSVGRDEVEWMRGFGLGFSNPVGTGGVLDVCLGCSGEWLECLDQGLEGWGGVIYVCVSCESGFYV